MNLSPWSQENKLTLFTTWLEFWILCLYIWYSSFLFISNSDSCLHDGLILWIIMNFRWVHKESNYQAILKTSASSIWRIIATLTFIVQIFSLALDHKINWIAMISEWDHHCELRVFISNSLLPEPHVNWLPTTAESLANFFSALTRISGRF